MKASDIRARLGRVSQTEPLFVHTEQRRNRRIAGLKSKQLLSGGGFFIFCGDRLANHGFIPGALLLILVGGAIATLGWHECEQVWDREDMIASLSEANSANHETFAAVANLSPREDNPRLLNYTLARPVETASLTAALASGRFVGREHEELRARMRTTLMLLSEYNYTLLHKYVSQTFVAEPKGLPELASQGLQEVDGLAALLATQYRASSLVISGAE